MNKKKFYVTTPIYYVSGKPHVGSLYTTVLADVLARWHRLLGCDTFFLTGTDEHGQKIAEAAKNAGKSPKEFVDGFIDAYQKTWHAYHIEYDKFIRTTDVEHKKAVVYLIELLKKKGDIYKGSYSGWYCTPCETFVTGKPDASGTGPVCPQCGRATVSVSEECYFFKLSAYQDKLLQFFNEHPDFIEPRERLNEVRAFVESGLKDLSISRSTVKWGIPFPGDAEQIVYVWIDALTNYISAIGYGDAARAQELAQWWPADVQVMAKDIVRFHAVYWPAFLMAAGLPLPKRLLVHGWLTVDGRKMSKSFGNVVDPMELLSYGADPVRYYLVSRLSVAQDANFSYSELEGVITQDLANELGNLLNRMVVLAYKHDCAVLEKHVQWSAQANKLKTAHDGLLQLVSGYLAQNQFHLAYAEVKRFVGQVNAYVHECQPWVQAEQDKQQFVETVTAVASCLYTIAHLLWPVMPRKMHELLAALGYDVQLDINGVVAQAWSQAYTLQKIAPLFQKVEGKHVVPETTVVQPQEEIIEIGDFARVHIVTGTVTAAEAVQKSDKLLKLQINCGEYGIRQVLSGIRAQYTPEALVGQQVIVIVNLKPRVMMGMESQGMVLLAKGPERLALLKPNAAVPDGTRIG